MKLLVIFIALMILRPSAPTSASPAAVGNFSTPHNSVRLSLRDRSIVAGNRRRTRPRILRIHAIAALDEMHSRLRLRIATAVGRRGKWRT
ncbi:hypothetical protein MA20_21750 [Bradyrhizobium japonicum]|uniref:Uncharacterized protein n=1 Tax=Bradyrhizobium japonicum TaxID=375 RepID=A0A0A3XS62_BRAJP|nr:hypothetical protein MA20_21750 [Bradyrhizobium japonicum]